MNTVMKLMGFAVVLATLAAYGVSKADGPISAAAGPGPGLDELFRVTIMEPLPQQGGGKKKRQEVVEGVRGDDKKPGWHRHEAIKETGNARKEMLRICFGVPASEVADGDFEITPTVGPETTIKVYPGKTGTEGRECETKYPTTLDTQGKILTLPYTHGCHKSVLINGIPTIVHC